MWIYLLYLCVGISVLYGILQWWRRQKLIISNITDRHVLITGCDTGFGNLLAKHLDKMGFHVFACCLTESAQKELRRQCSSNVIPLELDVTKQESVMNCLQQVQEHLGDKGLWGLVNNAGIGGTMAPFEMLPIHHIEHCINVNLYGMLRVTKAFLPLVRKSRGRIVIVSSMCGKIATSFVPYTVSKYAVEGFSDRLRQELYPTGVSVHILEPGGFQTSLIDQEKQKKTLSTLYEQADEEVQDYYGKHYINVCLDKLDTVVETYCSPHLWKVVEAYAHALSATYPKYRYIVGNDAYFMIKIVANMPEWLQDYLMYKALKIAPDKCMQNSKS